MKLKAFYCALTAVLIFACYPNAGHAQVDCQSIMNQIMGGRDPGTAQQLAAIYNANCLGGQRQQPTRPPGSVACGSGYCSAGNMCVSGNRCRSIADLERDNQLRQDAELAAQQYREQERTVKNSQMANVVSGLGSLLGNFGGMTNSGQIHMPGALPSGDAGILSAQLNTVRMPTVIWNPTAPASVDPFAAHVVVPRTFQPQVATTTNKPNAVSTAAPEFFNPNNCTFKGC